MKHYNPLDPDQKPLYDMMDEIEVAYNKADQSGIEPMKVKTILLLMVQIYGYQHQELEKQGGDILSMLINMRFAQKQYLDNPPLVGPEK